MRRALLLAIVALQWFGLKVGAQFQEWTTALKFLAFLALVLAAFLRVSPGTLLLGVLPHAIPELIALFLPLAAWIIASRRGEWEQLLAATGFSLQRVVRTDASIALIEAVA